MQSGGVVEPWLDSPPNSQEFWREHDAGHHAEEVRRMQSKLADLEASFAELLAAKQELEEELSAEREQHAAVEAYWQRQGEELLSHVREADHELIRREGALAEREAAAEQLRRQVADDQENLKAEQEELYKKKLMNAEKELELQDREAALQEKADAMNGPLPDLESRRSSAASFESAWPGMPPQVSSPEPPTSQPPEMHLEEVSDFSDEISEDSESPGPSVPRLPLRGPGHWYVLRGCGAGALIFAFQAVWRVLGHGILHERLRPLPSGLHSRPQEPPSTCSPLLEGSSSMAADEEALQRLVMNRTAALGDAERLLGAIRRSPEEVVNVLLERDAEPFGTTEEVAAELENGTDSEHSWGRLASGSAIGLVAAGYVHR